MLYSHFLVAPNFRHMETVISLETVLSNTQSSEMSESEGYYLIAAQLLQLSLKHKHKFHERYWISLLRENFFKRFFNCDVTTVTCDPSPVSLPLYTTFSHFKHFHATCAFPGAESGLAGFCGTVGSLHAAGSSVTAARPLG